MEQATQAAAMGAFQSARPVKGATAMLGSTRGIVKWFQSARPVKGATSGRIAILRFCVGFNPRAP